MPYTQTLIQATLVMVLGMGVVFFFLALLVFAMNIMSRLLAKYSTPEPAPAAPLNNNNNAVVTAITAAMKQYLKDKKK